MDPNLKQQCMINQFVLAAGCHAEQAKQFLQAAQWQFETALSMFFQESTTPSMCRTCNRSHTNGNYPGKTEEKEEGHLYDIREKIMYYVKILMERPETDTNCGANEGQVNITSVSLHQKNGLIARFTLCTPANTPATPPNFPDALAALAKLTTGDNNRGFGSSPHPFPSPAQQSQQSMAHSPNSMQMQIETNSR